MIHARVTTNPDGKPTLHLVADTPGEDLTLQLLATSGDFDLTIFVQTDPLQYDPREVPRRRPTLGATSNPPPEKPSS